ncbi:MAG: 4-(cytidine 5'-diphospho)-2-C-methyl-D-erythritol kinase [Spirochaetes bacterium]|nr:4-(cytidine 5'-diphospho)-2-C-methyl-D-erythritol kinase [Spirochaetota bacterium]
MKLVKSYAKINLFLDVISIYKNGFHGIKSIFSEISLFDQIQYEKNDGNKIHVIVSQDTIPEDNLLTKAADHFFKFTGKSKIGFNFYLEKNIPIGGGLGGGSSNAAAVIKILNKECDTNLRIDQLKRIAGKIGSDVPFFIQGGIQQVKGTGNRLTPLSQTNFGLNFMLIIPNARVSTPLAYSYIDQMGLAKKTVKNQKAYKQMTEAIQNNDTDLFIANIYNKFEIPIFSHYPELANIKKELFANDADQAFMSGSGSTMIGIYKNEKKMHKSIANFSKIGYKAFTVNIR